MSLHETRTVGSNRDWKLWSCECFPPLTVMGTYQSDRKLAHQWCLGRWILQNLYSLIKMSQTLKELCSHVLSSGREKDALKPPMADLSRIPTGKKKKHGNEQTHFKGTWFASDIWICKLLSYNKWDNIAQEVAEPSVQVLCRTNVMQLSISAFCRCGNVHEMIYLNWKEESLFQLTVSGTSMHGPMTSLIYVYK